MGALLLAAMGSTLTLYPTQRPASSRAAVEVDRTRTAESFTALVVLGASLWALAWLGALIGGFGGQIHLDGVGLSPKLCVDLLSSVAKMVGQVMCGIAHPALLKDLVYLR